MKSNASASTTPTNSLVDSPRSIRPAAGIKAGRLLLSEIRDSIRRNETFALESTISGKTYLRLLRTAKERGFRLHLHYLWLPTPALAIARVRERVKKGGHNVPSVDIRRRFARSLASSHDWLSAIGRPLGRLG